MKNLSGKQLCKKALQNKFRLPERNIPVVGMITRLTDQKGLDLVVNKFQDLMKADLQFVLLGTGEQKYQELFQTYANKYPAKVAVKLNFDECSAHEIEAGSDMFLMPSKYEPCGLGQLIAMEYGTIPIVRSTGGLADTVKRDSGFSFKKYNSSEADKF